MTDRSISTVLDVSLALVLISASVLMLFVFAQSEDTQSNPVRADQTAETLAGTTASVEYSIDEVLENDGEYDSDIFADVPEDSHYLDRSAHGSVTGLLADASVANVAFWDNRWTRAGIGFERAVNGVTLGSITGLNHSVRLNAIWRPHEGSGIVGEAAAGQAVPPDAAVNSVTFVAPSGMDSVTEKLEDEYQPDGEFDDTAEIVAEEVLGGLLPPEKMQRSLESTSTSRDLALYRYNRMSRVMDTIHDEDWPDEDLVDPDWELGYPFDKSDLGRQEANALFLNEYMAEQTLKHKIREDLQGTFDGVPTVEELTAAVSVDEVQVTVRTWETHE